MDKQISDILKSKRFWSALIGLLAIIITGVSPGLEEHIDTIVPGILGIIGIIIGGYTMQDVAREVKQGETVIEVLGDEGGELSTK